MMNELREKKIMKMKRYDLKCFDGKKIEVMKRDDLKLLIEK